MATLYTAIPVRRYWRHKGACTTKIYRRILAEMQRCMASGGAVDLEQSRETSSAIKHGDVIERITVRLDWPEAGKCD